MSLRNALTLRDAFESPERLDTPFLYPDEACAWDDDFLGSLSSSFTITATGAHSIGMTHADAPGTDQQTVTAVGEACC